MMSQEEKIIAYLSEELESAEKQAFEAEVAADPKLKAELDAYRELQFTISHQDTLNQFGSLLKDIAGEEAAEKGENKTSEATQVKPLWQRNSFRIALAAVVALLLAVAFWPRQGSNAYDQYYAPLAAEEIAPVEGSDLVSAPEDAPAKRLNAAIQSYKDGAYAAALQQLQAQDLAMAYPEEVLFFRGLCQLELEAFEAAIADLKAVAELRDNAFRYNPAANWYLALAYLKQGKKQASIPHLNYLKAGDSPFKSLASAVLTEVGG